MAHLASVLTMNPQTQKALRFLQSWIINTVAVLVAVMILHKGISYEDRLQNLLPKAAS